VEAALAALRRLLGVLRAGAGLDPYDAGSLALLARELAELVGQPAEAIAEAAVR
jgi:hypothetical protein